MIGKTLKTYEHYVNVLIPPLIPRDHYFVKDEGSDAVAHYIIDKDGVPLLVRPPISPLLPNDVIAALGYTPYSTTNPSGYITASSNNILTNKTGNISQWTNDRNFITIAAIPTKLSQFENDPDFVIQDVIDIEVAARISADNTLQSHIATETGLRQTADTNIYTAIAGKQDTLGYTPVPDTRTINGHALTSNVTIVNTDITEDGTHRWTTDTEKSIWNAKQSAITTGTNLQYFKGNLSLGIFPTNVSSFTNDSGYITPSSTSLFTNKTGNISQWTNDVGYLTSIGVAPAALTKSDDTNVTLTLEGSSNIALLQAINVVVGWTGTLSDARIASAAIWNAKQDAITTGTSSQFLKGNLTLGTIITDNASLTNGAGYITGISGSNVITALGYTPYNATNPSSYISSITSGMIVTALGFTPYSDSNPAGYITSSALSSYLTSATAASTYVSLSGSYANPTWITSLAYSKLTGAPTDNTSFTNGAGYATTSAVAAAYQPLDTDLTTIAGLTATTDNFIVSVSSAWASRTPSQVRTTLGLAIGTDVQAFNSNLTTYSGIAPSANVQTLLGAASYAAFKTSLSLNNVENTALSTWAGSSNITTLGTIGTGIWNGTAIGDTYISSATTWNAKQAALTFTSPLVNTANTVAIGGLSGLGTANQVLGMNNAGTAYEYKTISTSTTAVSNDVGVTLSGANAIVINIPNASSTVRGIVTTSAQTFNGLKTFSTGITSTGAITGNSVANAVVANGNIKIGIAGGGLYITEGTNCTMGVATLVAGTVTVSTTKVTASSRIFLEVQSLGTVAVATPVAITARSAGTSFTISSSSITDTSVIAWIIIEPA